MKQELKKSSFINYFNDYFFVFGSIRPINK